MKYIRDKNYSLVSKNMVGNDGQYTIKLELECQNSITQRDIHELEKASEDIQSVAIDKPGQADSFAVKGQPSDSDQSSSSLMSNPVIWGSILTLLIIAVVGFGLEPSKKNQLSKPVASIEISEVTPEIIEEVPQKPPAPPELSPEAKQKIEINKLMTAGDEILDRSDLTEELITIALEQYQKALVLDPENQAAINRLDSVAQHYIQLADQAILDKNPDQAKTLIQLAVNVIPERNAIQQAQQRLAELQESIHAEQNNEKIEQLLIAAVADFEADRLALPTDNNALLKFQQVLVLDEENEQARQGLKNITDRYHQLAEKALNNKDLKATESYLSQSSKLVDSNNEQQRLLAQRLAKAKTHIKTKTVKAKPIKKPVSRVTQLLAAAHQDLKSGRLDTPKNNNALDRYQTVLSIDPNNTTAKNGLNNLANAFISSAEDAINRQKLSQAENYMRQASKLKANSEKLRLLQKSLSDAKFEQALEKTWLP